MKLNEKDGTLYVFEHMLIYTYPAGDCDRIPWPREDDTPEELARWEGQLAVSLFDAREMGLWDGNCIELPDGTEFYPDEHLEDYKPPSTEGWLY